MVFLELGMQFPHTENSYPLDIIDFLLQFAPTSLELVTYIYCGQLRKVQYM